MTTFIFLQFENDLYATVCIRAQLYGLGHPRPPFPGGNFIERLYVKTHTL